GESNGMATDQALYALVALYRYDHGHRSLYDFRPELEKDVQEEISLVEEKINALNNNKNNVADVWNEYENIPVEERSYVFNYALLANEMVQQNIENNTEPISENIGINKAGNGKIMHMFS